MRPPVTIGTIFIYFFALCQSVTIAQNKVVNNEKSPSPEVYQTGEKERYLLKTYTTKDGLPQNTPLAIVQTKDGYIWLATFGGLARFDGVKFTNFNTSNTPALINNRITALYEDRNGILWLGSEDGDIMSYQNGEFSLIKKSSGPPIDTTIFSFWVDRQNILWIATGKELRTYNIKTKEFTVYLPDQILKKRATSEATFHSKNFHVDAFTEDTAGTLWIGSNEGLISHRDGVFNSFNQDDGLPDNHIYSMLANADGGIWISVNNRVGSYLNGSFTTIFEAKEGPVIRLGVSPNNQLFFTHNQIYEVKENKLIPFEVPNDVIFDAKVLFIDRQENLWLGVNNGLTRLTQRKIQVFAVAKKDHWRSVISMIEHPDKSVWVVGGFDLLRWQNGIFSQILTDKDKVFSNNLALDKDNNVLIGTTNGIFQVTDAGKTKQMTDTLNGSPKIFLDKDKNIWYGQNETGVYKIEGDSVKNYRLKDGLTNNWITFIGQSQNGAMIFGTKGGVSIFQDGQFSNYTNLEGLVNENVRDVYEDAEGTKWIGTYGGGISRLKDNQIITITSNNGLAENIVSRIIEDDYGFFWILGNQGIYTVSRKSLNDFANGKIKRVYCTVYDESDGMIIGEGSGGNQPAGIRTSDGKIWFPMIKGGIIIDSIKPNLTPIPVYIEEVSLNDQKVDSTKSLEIKPDQGNLEINYSAISFIKPEQIQFRYKLEGYDPDWQDVGTRRVAYYPFLPPGSYTFRVIATNGSDVWSENDASLKIAVRAPFWRTWWFWTLVSLGLILLVVWIYQRRLALLQRRRLRQEEFARQLINAHETERNRIAGELHDSLGQNLLVSINWLLVLLKQLPEKNKYRPKINDLYEIINGSLEEIRTIARNLRPQHLKRFGLTQTIDQMVKQMANSSDFELELELDDVDNLFSSDDELSIYRILQECLNNVAKHSEASKVTVKIEKIGGNVNITNAQDKLRIQVIDNGKGFDLQEKKKTSFGLDSIDQRVQLLGGKYSINSIIGKGTEVLIYMNIQERKNV